MPKKVKVTELDVLEVIWLWSEDLQERLKHESYKKLQRDMIDMLKEKQIEQKKLPDCPHCSGTGKKLRELR